MHKIKKPAQPNIPVEEALKILQKAAQENTDNAWAEIQAVLEKYKFRFEIKNTIFLIPKV